MTNTETNHSAAAGAEPGAPVARQKAASKKVASQKKGAHKGRGTARGAKSGQAAQAGKKKSAGKAMPRTASKGAQILELIGRAQGAALAEIMTATGWQAHSVRGFLSTAGKKHGIPIESSRNEAGQRVYRTK